MNKLSIILILFALLITFTGNSQNIVDAQQTTPGVSPDQLKAVYDNTFSLPENAQLAIGFIRNGNVTYYGIERRSDSVITVVNHDRAFEIGSISKVFTATLLADMVVQNKIALDDPVNGHLPAMRKENPAITFAQLSNHTSGLPRLPPNLNPLFMDQNNPYKDYSKEKMDEFLASEIRLGDAPGNKYAYSNLGAGLLGYTLASIEKTTYEDLLQKRVLIPLKMSNTTTDRSRVTDRLVIGRNGEGKETSNWDLNILAGAGGILSTVEDLGKFAVAQFDDSNAVYALTRKPTFKITERGEIGLGWHLFHDENGKTYVAHDGGTGGYTSSLILDFQNRKGVIILSNVSALSAGTQYIGKLSAALIRSEF